MSLHKIVNGVKVDLTPIEEQILLDEWKRNEKQSIAISYQEQRREAYPPIQEQLDMLYKDKLNNTTLWVDMISKIKSDTPKPLDK